MEALKTTKIVVIYTAIQGSSKITGGIRRLFEISNQLLRKGDIVHLFIPKNVYPDRHECLIEHSIVSHSSKILPNGVLNFIFNYRKLKSISKLKYDALIIFEISYGIQCVLLNLKKLVVFTRQDFIEYRSIYYDEKSIPLFLKYTLKRVYLFLLEKIEKIVLLKTYRIVVQSYYERNTLLIRHNSIRNKIKEKIVVIYNNVNPSWIAAYDDQSLANTRKDDTVFNFCFIGNVDDKRKGLHILLEAIAKIIDDCYRVELIIIGAGKKLKYYKEEYQAYNEIKFLGYIQNPMEILVKSDLLVVPSLADSFPNVIMEAFYLEKPVIGSNRGGIPEMLKYDELLFESNVDSLFKKIEHILHENLFGRIKELVKERKRAFTFDWVEAIRREIF